MVDTSRAKWDLSKEELYAVQWFNENGFSGELVKQHLSKTYFSISKNGVEDRFELPQGYKDMNIRAYMAQYEKAFSLLCELQRLRAEASKTE